MSERPNAETLTNYSLLTVMDTTSYQIQQHFTIYIGEVLAHSGRGS